MLLQEPRYLQAPVQKPLLKDMAFAGLDAEVVRTQRVVESLDATGRYTPLVSASLVAKTQHKSTVPASFEVIVKNGLCSAGAGAGFITSLDAEITVKLAVAVSLDAEMIARVRLLATLDAEAILQTVVLANFTSSPASLYVPEPSGESCCKQSFRTLRRSCY